MRLRSVSRSSFLRLYSIIPHVMVNGTALRRNPILFTAVLLLLGWILLGALSTVGEMSTEPAYEFVGQAPASGWIGMLVMAASIGLLLLLYTEIGDMDQLPEQFPPKRHE